ncbi:hypothetical protein ACROYT_G015147 [Oculina patagonica]
MSGGFFSSSSTPFEKRAPGPSHVESRVSRPGYSASHMFHIRSWGFERHCISSAVFSDFFILYTASGLTRGRLRRFEMTVVIQKSKRRDIRPHMTRFFTKKNVVQSYTISVVAYRARK